MFGAATSAAPPDQGWLDDLLRWTGVAPTTAHHLQLLLGKPFAVVLVIVLAVVASRMGNRVIRHWIGSAARRAVARVDSPRAAARATAATAVAASAWRSVVAVIAFFTVLTNVGLNLTPLVAGATVIGAALGFGAQTMVRDLLAGFLLIVEDQYGIGDVIEVGDITGAVEDFSLRVTRLRGDDGVVWFVANGEIRKLANSSRGWARATVDYPVPPGSDVERVLEATADAARRVGSDPHLGPLCLEPPKTWGVVGVAIDSLSTRVTVKTSFTERDRLERALREEIARQLHLAGILGVSPAAAAANDEEPADPAPESEPRP